MVRDAQFWETRVLFFLSPPQAEHEVAVSRVGADYAEEDLFEDFVVEHSGPEEEEEEQGEEDKGDNRGWKRPILDRLSVERPAKFR